MLDFSEACQQFKEEILSLQTLHSSIFKHQMEHFSFHDMLSSHLM